MPARSPELFTLSNVVVPDWRSRTKTSLTPLVSLATRLEASLSKATNRPSAEMTGETEWRLPPPTPVRFTLTRVVVLFVRLRRKTSINLPSPSSFVDKLLAELRKRTKRPSALMVDPLESLFPLAGARSVGFASETACTAESAWPSTAAVRTQLSITARNPFEDDFFMAASLFAP